MVNLPPKIYWGKIDNIHKTIKKVAPTDITVLIQGETGTGKRLTAKVLHALSQRKNQPFIPVSCVAIPNEWMEGGLFGHEEGGFPGSASYIEDIHKWAYKGTIFLEEIGDMSLDLQAKVLHFLDEQKFHRFRGKKTAPVDVRIIAAAKKDLIHAVGKGTFRRDLYYMLNVVTIKLPLLKERKDDILPLAKYFIAGRAKDISPNAAHLLVSYHWPGNIRELKNCIDRAIALGDGRVIQPEDLPPSIQQQRQIISAPLGSLAHMEEDHIIKVLKYTSWNKSDASRILGITVQELGNKIKKYKIMDQNSTNLQGA